MVTALEGKGLSDVGNSLGASPQFSESTCPIGCRDGQRIKSCGQRINGVAKLLSRYCLGAATICDAGECFAK